MEQRGASSPAEARVPSPDLLAEIDDASARLDKADAGEIIEWAVGRFPGEVAVAASFQDAVLLDIAVGVDPRIEVIFLDTGFHFPETLAYVERLRRPLRPQPRGHAPRGGPSTSSLAVRVAAVSSARSMPLAKALRGHRAWITGLKRVDTPERAEAPVIAWDPAATW